MTAGVLSIAHGQQAVPTAPPAAPAQDQGGAQWVDQDAVRAQMDAARGQMDSVRAQMDMAREKAQQVREALRDSVRPEVNEQVRQMARDAVRSIDAGAFKGIEAGVVDGFDVALAQNMALSRIDVAGMQMLLAQDMSPKAPIAPIPPIPPRPMKGWNFDSGSGSYESGKSALENHNYDRAVEIFDRVINSRTPSSRADGAYYWKAYALNKLGKRDEALAALAELSNKFPQSSWLNDAKALQAEVQQAKGQPVSPENQADEDLKLYAINALINSDADRAVPLLEGLLSNPKMSPRLKERALFVLAQSRSDKAHDIVGRYAKGGSNPDLQLTAVQYLGTYRSKESRQVLAEVYGSVSDVNVKRAVLRGFEMSRDVDDLAKIARSEQNVDLRREAVRQLGNLHDEQSVSTLVTIYNADSDKEIKTEILNSLRNQGAARQIVECARKESDPEMKKNAVRILSEMHSKDATDFLMEILK